MSILERVSIGSLAQGAAPPGYTFTRSTTATYIDSDGLLKVAAINTPRRQWDSANRRWGYVGEPGRTNLLLRSEEFDKADRASRAAKAESLTEFCRAAILERAEGILAQKERGGR